MSLPSHRSPTSNSLPEVCKYVVQSSDVLENLRIHVLEAGSDKVVWYKERYLSDEEVIENIVDNATSTPCWSIHRPIRGWYIRIRAPSFPPGIYIPLAPLPVASPFRTEAALSFSCRTMGRMLPSSAVPPHCRSPPASCTAKSSMETSASSSESTVVHSYPPTPPTPKVIVQPPSPRSVQARLDELLPPQDRRQRRPPMAVTQFILAPHSTSHVPQVETASFFARALSIFRNHKPSHSTSFTLCPMPPTLASVASPVGSLSSASTTPASSPTPLISSEQRQPAATSCVQIPAPTPLLTFHDQTPLWTIYSNTGAIQIDTSLEKDMGLDRSFWIAVALAYMEFLGDREGYLAASDG